MKQPIPRNGTEPLKVGDHVRIRTVVPDLVFQPGEWIEADRLVVIPLKTENR